MLQLVHIKCLEISLRSAPACKLPAVHIAIYVHLFCRQVLPSRPASSMIKSPLKTTKDFPRKVCSGIPFNRGTLSAVHGTEIFMTISLTRESEREHRRWAENSCKFHSKPRRLLCNRREMVFGTKGPDLMRWPEAKQILDAIIANYRSIYSSGAICASDPSRSEATQVMQQSDAQCIDATRCTTCVVIDESAITQLTQSRNEMPQEASNKKSRAVTLKLSAENSVLALARSRTELSQRSALELGMRGVA